MIKLITCLVECSLSRRWLLWRTFAIVLTYHKQYFYTEEQLDEVLGTSDFVTVHCMTKKRFMNFGLWQHEAYVESSDSITRYHLFSFGEGQEFLSEYGYKVFDSENKPKKSKELKPSLQTTRLTKDYTPEKQKITVCWWEIYWILLIVWICWSKYSVSLISIGDSLFHNSTRR